MIGTVALVLRSGPRTSCWLASEAMSAFGDQFLIVALSAAAAFQHGPLATGLVLGAGAVPRAVLGIGGGIVVDRIGARRAMLLADGSRTLLLSAAVVIVSIIGASLTVLIAVAVVAGVFGALFEPASVAIAPALVDGSQLVALSALRMGIGRAAMLVGAPVAGLVVLSTGVGTAFAVDATSFAASTLGVYVLRPRNFGSGNPDRPNSAAAGVPGELRMTFEYVLSHPLLRPALLTMAAVEFALTGAINTGLPVLSAQRGWGPVGIGILFAAFGAGSLVGPLAAPLLTRLDHPVRTGLIATIGGAIGFAGLTALRGLLFAGITVGALGAAVSLLAAQLLPAVQRACDVRFLGRVGGLMTAALAGSAPLSMLLAGLLAAAAGSATLTICSGVAAAVACVAALTSPVMRAAGCQVAQVADDASTSPHAQCA